MGKKRKGKLSFNQKITIALLIIIPLTAAFIGIVPFFSQETDSNIEIVDIQFPKSEEYPIIDIKMRNIGSNAAFIHKAIIQVYNNWELSPFYAPKMQIITWNYDFLFSEEKSSFNRSLILSQSISGKDTDRFTITLGFNSSGVNFRLYHMKIIFIYDEDYKEIATSDILILIRPNIKLYGAYYPPREAVLEEIEHNLNVLKEVEHIDAIRNDLWNQYISSFKYDEDNTNKIFVARTEEEASRKPIFYIDPTNFNLTDLK